MPPKPTHVCSRRANPACGSLSRRRARRGSVGVPAIHRPRLLAAARRAVAASGAWDQELPRLRPGRSRQLIGATRDSLIGASDSGGESPSTGDLLLPHTPGVRVLLVDASAALRMAVALLLMREGYGVLTAPSTHAIDRARVWNPDVVLLNVLDPAAEEATAFVRAYRAALGEHTPVVALAANPEAARGIGANHVLATPIDFDELLRVLERCARRGAGGARESKRRHSDTA
jgi:CheY-like chemotaxis protein